MKTTKDQIKDALWILVQQYYNVDRKNPNVLTYKKVSGNGIDKIGEQLGLLVEQAMLIQKVKQRTEFDEDNFIETCNWWDNDGDIGSSEL